MYDTIQFGALTLRKDRPFLVAEAGVNHENRLDLALRMIEEAAEAGADAIKFQSYKADTLASRHSPAYWDLTAESTRSQYELFKKYDSFGDAEYARLADHAKDCGIIFLSTPFDFHFADSLKNLMPCYKIASADLTNLPLVRHCALKGKPMIVSVGASTVADIERTVSEIHGTGNHQIALLHCVLSYPCKPEDANLRVITRLKEVFPSCVIGYSDHVPPAHGCLALTTAWLHGARILEKHFTLDKTRPGNDHYHAFDPDDIRNFRIQCDYVTSLVGQAQKEVLACEQAAHQQARRSLVAAKPIRQGQVVTRDMIAIKRPGTGIPSEYLESIINSRALRDIEDDEILKWEMFLQRGSGSAAQDSSRIKS
jgi:N-acetylneuraminate synthase